MPAVNHSAKLAATLTAWLGTLAGGRVYCGRAPQGSPLPRIVWHEIVTTRDHAHDSGTTADAGVEDTVVQFDCEARTPTECRALADVLASLADGGTYSGPAIIQGGFRETGGAVEALDYATGDGMAEAYSISTDYRFFWRDA